MIPNNNCSKRSGLIVVLDDFSERRAFAGISIEIVMPFGLNNPGREMVEGDF